MGFKPFGVCLRETNLLKAEDAYNAEVCPYADILTKKGGEEG
jgi:hypothetical protein